MADLLTLSARILDAGAPVEVGPVNRITHELSTIADGVAMVEAFSHSIVFETVDGLVVFDTSGARSGKRVVDAIRGWSRRRFHTVVYTHGHIDHVGGCGAFLADNQCRGEPVPAIVGHENVARRFERYRLTNGYNQAINARQFLGLARRGYGIGGDGDSFLPRESAPPDVTYRDRLDLNIGGLDLELHHGKGETDDHTWTWIPRHRAICAGDFFIWNFPNAGNPQKVQRYPLEWAAVLRRMARQGAELFLPAHGLPIAGRERIARVLDDVAQTLEQLVDETLALMNAGAPLDAILHTVKVPAEKLERPYLRPLYDEPEFVVRNVWRMYGGWYDGNPARLKPARDAALAVEIATLAGGAIALAKRAQSVAGTGDLRLACHLIEYATLADPANAELHAIRAEIYQSRRDAERSLMSRGIFGQAAAESRAKAGLPDPE